jgi:dihydroflavonol-4-reductase
MAATLVTGATGFIGQHVARLLVARGDHVRVAVREGAVLDGLAGLEVERATCDVLDRRSVRRAMRDVERVFHVAGRTSLRAPADELFRINVDGTRVVLGEALRAGVERVVHTSSVAALGPAPEDEVVDETQVFRAARLGLPYVNAKHEAENEALRLAAQGLDVVIVNPGHCLGPGDLHRSSTEVVRRFLRREIPAYVDGTLNVVDVEDAARGHLLADERGRPGQRYILGNRNFTLDRLFADLGRLSGVEPPAVKLPLPAALAFARGLEALPGRPAITTDEVRTMAQRWAYRSTKARRELGWSVRHHEEALVRTIAWYREREPQRLARPGARQPLPLRAAGLGVRTAGAVLGRLPG